MEGGPIAVIVGLLLVISVAGAVLTWRRRRLSAGLIALGAVIIAGGAIWTLAFP